MFLHAKRTGFPTLQRVAFRALAFAGACLKLAFVGIRGMAINAFVMSHRGLEVAVGVAVGACHGAMLSKQREFCLRVIEAFELSDLRPALGVMAGLACAAEAPLVRIDVARRARFESDAGVFHVRLGVSDCRMAPVAGHGRVCSG